eukprot:8409321-Pyramimonas_sp.AAC.1
MQQDEDEEECPVVSAPSGQALKTQRPWTPKLGGGLPTPERLANDRRERRAAEARTQGYPKDIRATLR